MTIDDSGLVGVGTTNPDRRFHVQDSSAGSVTGNVSATIVAERSGTNYINVLTPAANVGGLIFGSPTTTYRGGITYDHANDLLQL